MAVALLDAPLDAGTTSLAQNGSFTVSAGTDRVLVYITAFEAVGTEVATVSFGGQAMTEVLDVLNPGGNDMRVQVWLLDEAGIAAASSSNFVHTGTGLGQFRAMAFSVQGALQTLVPFDTDFNNVSPNGAALSIDVEAEGFVFSLIATANTVDIGWTGVTEQLEEDSGMTRSLAFDTTPTTETQSHTPTLTGGGGGGQVSVSIALSTAPDPNPDAEILDAWQAITEGASFVPSAGTNRVVVVAAHQEGTDARFTGATYGDQTSSSSITQDTSAVAATFVSSGIIAVFTEADLAAATGTGINLQEQSPGQAGELQIFVATFENIDQINPLFNTDSSFNAAGGAGGVTVSTDDGGFAVAMTGVGQPADVTWSAPFVEQLEEDDASSTGSVSHVSTTGLGITATPSFDAANRSVALAAALRKAVPPVFVPVTGTASLTMGNTGVASGEFSVTGTATLTSGGTAIPDDQPETTLGLNSGNRRVFVSKTGNDANDGLSKAEAKLTIQAAFDIALPGDVISIASGIFYETPSLSNFSGTINDGLWIVAERRGETVVSDLWQEAFEGTQVWDDEGGGVFSAVHGDVWSGSHGNDFLFRYTSEADLRAAVLVVTGGLVGTNNITKPAHGFATENGRIYVRLRGDVNPNGQSIKLTDNFSQTLINFSNADNVIIDGIGVEGSGNTPAIVFSSNSANAVVRNCFSDHCRGLCRVSSDFLVEWCEFTKTGFAAWMRELIALDGQGNIAVFDINKNYNSLSGNTFYEGGMVFGTSSTDSGGEIRFNWIHGVFEGMRAGEHDDTDIHDNIIEECGDNGVEFESFRGSDQSANIRFFHNLVRNIHDSSTSHQPGNDFVGPHHVYRNVFVNDDTTLSAPIFMIKTINALTNHANPGSVDINYYHNLFSCRRGLNIQASPDDLSTIWSDDFANSDADAITLFANNVAIFQDDLDTTVGTGVPQNISDNILAASTDNAVYQGGGGSRVANEAALLLGANRQLLPGSPLIGAGGALSGTLPDIVTGANRNDDVGPFPDGFDPGANWPRVDTRFFENTVPEAFLSTLTGTITASSSASGNLTVLRLATGTAALQSGNQGDALELRIVEGTAEIDFDTDALSTGTTGTEGTAELTFVASATADIPPPPAPELDLAENLLSGVPRPVFLVDLEFDSGEVNIWTRPVEGQFRGKTYVPLAGVTGGLTVRNSLDQGSLDVSVQLSGQSPELLNIALTENYQRRPARVLFGNMDESYDIVAEEILIVGTISNMPITDDEDESIVSILIDSVFKDIERPRVLRLSTSDQAVINPDDTFFDFAATDDIEVIAFGG